VEGNPPYTYANHNPISLIDPDGRDPREAREGVIYTPQVYERAIDYYEEYGEYPSEEQVERWETESSLLQEGLVAALAFWGVSRGGQAFAGKALSPEKIAELRATFEATKSYTKASKAEGVSLPTLRKYVGGGRSEAPVGRAPFSDKMVERIEEVFAETGSYSRTAEILTAEGLKVSVYGVWSRIGGGRSPRGRPPPSPERVAEIRAVLAREGGDVSAAARELGVSRYTVRRYGQEQPGLELKK
jgi:hypothetical protein